MPGLTYAAGVNVERETMAMGKALVVSATPGIADYVQDGVTARVVPAGDEARLRAVVSELLADGSQRDALGARARAFAATTCSVDAYVRALSGVALDAIRHHPA